MRPVEHFVVALLPLLAYVLLRDRRLPTPRFVALLFVGSQFPDLVDKPLAHQFGVIPSGRVFLHSLPVALPFLLVVILYGYWTDRPRPTAAFAVAYLSHLFADNYRGLLGPTPTVSPDLLWPITEPVARPVVPYWAGPDGVNVRLWTLFSVVILTLLTYVVASDLRDHA